MRLKFAIVLELLSVTLQIRTAFSSDAYVQIAPQDVTWLDLPFDTRRTGCGSLRKPDAAGTYKFRVRMKDGAKLQTHAHPDTRMITVLSGKLYAGRGETYDVANETVVSAGEFFVVPAGSPHYTRAGDGEVVYQENGFGPSPTILPSK